MRLQPREAVEEVGVRRESVEPDRGPRRKRDGGSDEHGESERPQPPRRERPDEHRPEKELRRHRQAERDRRGPHRISIAPHEGERERQRDREIGEQHAADCGDPEKSGGVATDVAHLEDAERQEEQRDHARRDEGGRHGDGKKREREKQEQQLGRVHVSLLLVEYRIVERRIRRVAVQDGFRRRQICKAHVPRQETLRCAQSREPEHGGDPEEDERDRENSRTFPGGRRGPCPEASAADLIAGDDGLSCGRRLRPVRLASAIDQSHRNPPFE